MPCMPRNIVTLRNACAFVLNVTSYQVTWIIGVWRLSRSAYFGRCGLIQFGFLASNWTWLNVTGLRSHSSPAASQQSQTNLYSLHFMVRLRSTFGTLMGDRQWPPMKRTICVDAQWTTVHWGLPFPHIGQHSPDTLRYSALRQSQLIGRCNMANTRPTKRKKTDTVSQVRKRVRGDSTFGCARLPAYRALVETSSRCPCHFSSINYKNFGRKFVILFSCLPSLSTSVSLDLALPDLAEMKCDYILECYGLSLGLFTHI